jgi:methionyl-tRNA formyltransferase
LIHISTDSIQDVYAKYRAYAMWPKVYFMHNNKRVLIEQLVIEEKDYINQKELPIYTPHKDQTYTLHPSIRILLVKPEGKKSMSW